MSCCIDQCAEMIFFPSRERQKKELVTCDRTLVKFWLLEYQCTNLQRKNEMSRRHHTGLEIADETKILHSDVTSDVVIDVDGVSRSAAVTLPKYTVPIGFLTLWLITLALMASQIYCSVYYAEWEKQLKVSACNNAEVAFPIIVGPFFSNEQYVVWQFRYQMTTFNCTTTTAPLAPPVQVNVPHQVYISDNLQNCCTTSQKVDDIRPASNVVFLVFLVFLSLGDCTCIIFSILVACEEYNRYKDIQHL
jgi:hypothetical protein